MPISFVPYTAVYGPLSLPNVTCRLWLDGADPLGNNSVPANGATVSTWVDKSGNGYNATGGVSPTYNTSQKAIAFNGSSWLSTSYSSVPTNETVFVVFQTTSSAIQANCFMIGPTNNGGRLILSVNENDGFGLSFKIGSYFGPNGSRIAQNQNQMYLGTTTVASTTCYVYLNGTQGPSSTLTFSGTGTTQIGTANSVYNIFYIGYIYEIVIYNTTLGTPQQQAIEGYLAQKWGLTSQLPPGHPGLTQTLYNGKVYQPRIALQNAPYANYYPLSVANCQIWLDGGDQSSITFSSGSNVSQWRDKSGNGLHATVFGGTPTYTQALGMTFNGSSTLQVSYTGSPTIETLFIIIKFNSVANEGDIFSGTAVGQRQFSMYAPYNPGTIWLGRYGAGPSGAVNGGTVTTSTNYMLGYVFNGTANTISFYQQGSNTASGTPQFTYNAGGTITAIGSSSTGEYLQGQIYELIVYNTALTNNQRQSIEGYLAWKWGITLVNTQPYYSAPPLEYTRGSILPPPTLNATGNESYANTAYYNVRPQAWNYNWQPYLQSLAAANSAATATFSTSVVLGYSSPGNGAYECAVMAQNGKIYCIPSTAVSVGVIDPATNMFTTPVSGTSAGGYANVGGVLAPNGKIYCVPAGATAVGVIDPVANTFTTFGTAPGGDAYLGGVLAPNGKIYCIPACATTVGVIDPIAGTFNTSSVSGTVTGPGAGNFAYLGGVLAQNGKIYCIPFSATSVGVIDPVANTFTTFGSAPGTSAYATGVLAPNGKIYCAPAKATSIGVIDPVEGTFTTTSISGTVVGTGAGNYAYYSSTLGPNGKIYCIPANATSIGVIDTIQNTFTTFGSAPGTLAYIGGILAPNGNIYCIPLNASSVGVISFSGLKQNPNLNYCLSPYTNKL